MPLRPPPPHTHTYTHTPTPPRAWGGRGRGARRCPRAFIFTSPSAALCLPLLGSPVLLLRRLPPVHVSFASSHLGHPLLFSAIDVIVHPRENKTQRVPVRDISFLRYGRKTFKVLEDTKKKSVGSFLSPPLLPSPPNSSTGTVTVVKMRMRVIRVSTHVLEHISDAFVSTHMPKHTGLSQKIRIL